ncbi:hypothetical protein JZO77_15040 [Enterococcus hulanensis]|uniref:hypothetical protein n=1 Tax=Enterococcus hulanensis TaxID=2559929 RepID=UPI001A8EEF65|nr:hypothetical protein [Enterococcus hulanensis]MBO0458051.1 hypothetical protein [Enterococcus hulanensis]
MDRVLTLLTAKDTKEALAAFKKLEAECLAESIYADKLEEFLPALNAENSCGRGRAFKFFMLNARWDSQKIIDAHLEEILAILDDSKAPVVRQCIPYLVYLTAAKPEMTPIIRKKLENLDLSQYKESMQSLIKRDITKVLTEIKG